MIERSKYQSAIPIHQNWENTENFNAGFKGQPNQGLGLGPEPETRAKSKISDRTRTKKCKNLEPIRDQPGGQWIHKPVSTEN